MSRREYPIDIRVNGLALRKLIIDPHYEEKHARSISDELIIELVKTLSGNEYEADDIDERYSYFVNDRIEYQCKFYKLIWLLEDQQIYIGVINAYRR